MKLLKKIIAWSWPLLLSCLMFLQSCCTDCDECSDGMQNGTETGIDCGGSCNPCPKARYSEVIFPEYESLGESILDYCETITYDRNSFISGKEADLTLHFFEPKEDSETKRPLIIMLGGTMFAFSPWNHQFYSDDFYDYTSYFASRGYTFALLNTR